MDKPMGEVRQLDRRVNDAGLLRLMVPEPLAMNLSNSLSYLRGETIRETKAARRSVIKLVVNLGLVRKVLLAIYNRIFRWYYE
jgi:hypothetical protein